MKAALPMSAVFITVCRIFLRYVMLKKNILLNGLSVVLDQLREHADGDFAWCL